MMRQKEQGGVRRVAKRSNIRAPLRTRVQHFLIEINSPDGITVYLGRMEQRTSRRMLRRLPTRQVLPNATHGLRCDPQIRGQHELRHAAGDRRIHPQELEVSVLGAAGKHTHESPILGPDVPLQAGTKGGRKAPDAVHEALMRRTIDQQQLRMLDGVDEIRRRCAGAQAHSVRQPPGLRCELDYVFLASSVNDVATQAARGHECEVSSHVARSLQELTNGEVPEKNGGSDDLEVLIGERSPRLEVFAQNAKDGRRNRGPGVLVWHTKPQSDSPRYRWPLKAVEQGK